MLRAFVGVALVLPAAASQEVDRFTAWKARFGKAYASPEAELRARSAFLANDAIIEAHNALPASFRLGHNELSDLSVEGYASLLLGHQDAPLHRDATFPRSPPPSLTATHNSSVDWTKAGAVTAIKNQAHCGACWAFAATGAIEGAYAIASGTLVSLSEEQLISCDFAAKGCVGGNTEQAFQWIEAGNPLCSEADWPYVSGSGRTAECSSTCHPLVTIGGWNHVPSRDEDALTDALRAGPVAIAVEADHSSFQLYKGGVYEDGACGDKVNHAVLLVGFGTDDASGIPYYKLKNSWGTVWGEAGYMRIRRGNNTCGLARLPSYPELVAGVTSPASPRPAMPPVPPPGPPESPPPGTEYIVASSAAAFFSSALSLLAAALAVLRCLCVGRRLSILLQIAIGSVPGNVARVISGCGALRNVLPHHPSAWLWAESWQCHVHSHAAALSIGSGDGTNERNCAGLAMAHVISCSTALWSVAIGLHLICRALCTTGTRPAHFTRFLLCAWMPVLACGLLALDRVCASSTLPQWGRAACNTTGSPHLDSWADLADGVFSSGATSRDGDSWPLVLLAAPRLLAFITGFVALLFAAIYVDRLVQQHSRAGHEHLEPFGFACVFLFLALPAWLLSLIHAAEQRWLMSSSVSEAFGWLAIASDILFPLVGFFAAVAWWCGGRRRTRDATTSTAPRRARDGAAQVASNRGRGHEILSSWLGSDASIQQPRGSMGAARESLLHAQPQPPQSTVAVGVPVAGLEPIIGDAVGGQHVSNVESRPPVIGRVVSHAEGGSRRSESPRWYPDAPTSYA